MHTKIQSLLFLTALLIFVACNNDSSGGAQEVTFDVTFTCEETETDEIGPISSLYVTINSSKTKLADIRGCAGTLSSDEYAVYDVPTEAKAAAYGYWAGAGDYFYAIRDGEKLKIFRAEMDEMQDGKLDYEHLTEYQNGRFMY